MRLFRNSRGDTIVEVMLAIAIASSVIGGAYVVTNKTMANSRQAQEHSEALQIASAQIERIVYFAEHEQERLFDGTPNLQHCADKTTGALVDISDPANIPANCKGFGLAGLYTATFAYEPSNNDTFRIKVVWDSQVRSDQEVVTLTYKPYQP